MALFGSGSARTSNTTNSTSRFGQPSAPSSVKERGSNGALRSQLSGVIVDNLDLLVQHLAGESVNRTAHPLVLLKFNLLTLPKSGRRRLP